MFAPETSVWRALHAALMILATFAGAHLAADALRQRRPQAGARVARRIHYATIELWLHVALMASGAELVSRNEDVRAALAPQNLWLRSPLPAPVAYFYGQQITYYVVGLVMALCDAATPDRGRMLAHHAVTLFLIGYSVLHGMWPVGLAVLLACDPSDVALHLSKLAKDAFESEISALLFFLMFIALWVWQRLRGIVVAIIVPYVASFFCASTLVCGGGGVAVPDTTLGVALGLAALGALFVVWTAEIGRAVWRKLRHGSLEDVREDAAPCDCAPPPPEPVQPPVQTPPVQTPPVQTPPVQTPPVQTPPVQTPPVQETVQQPEPEPAQPEPVPPARAPRVRARAKRVA